MIIRKLLRWIPIILTMGASVFVLSFLLKPIYGHGSDILYVIVFAIFFITNSASLLLNQIYRQLYNLTANIDSIFSWQIKIAFAFSALLLLGWINYVMESLPVV